MIRTAGIFRIMLVSCVFGCAASAYAADIYRTLAVDVDPIAPASAAYETQHGADTSKWGVGVDYNVRGEIATGPDIWVGNFTQKGPNDPSSHVRREDLQYGEQQKLEAMRFRWTFTFFERATALRGWYLKTGYNYMRINSRANRFVGAETTLTDGGAPRNTVLLSDIRHGVMIGAGQRWMASNHALTMTLGASTTINLRRVVSVDGDYDPDARRDYDAMIETLPETRMTARIAPELNLTVGYLL